MFATPSLNGIVGHAALIVGLAASVFGALALVIATTTGDRRLLRSIANYAWMALGGAVIAVAVMERALITRDFSLAYIQQVGSRDTPVLFNVTALWSALEGSILLWLLILAIYTAVIMHRYRRRLDDPLVAWALVVMFAVTAFFFFLSFGPIDAFRTGRAPQLQPMLPRAKPAAAEPHPRPVPPADPVSRLRRLHGAVRLRHRRARSPGASARVG